MARYYTSFSLGGRIAAIYDTKMLSRGITYRNVLIETAADKEKFSNSVIVSFFGTDADKLKDFKTGNLVEVSGEVQGHYSERTNHWWNLLAAETIRKTIKAQRSK